MQKKDLHITFGFSGTALLTQSQLVDLDQDEIVGFTDSLCLGPLCTLDDTEAIENRKSWWEKVLRSIRFEYGNSSVDDDLHLLRDIISSADRYSSIYLWLGDDANEKITIARLLSYLKELSTPIHKLNFHHVDFRNEKGEKLNLGSLQVMRAENIPGVAKHFEKLSDDDIQSYATLWENIYQKQEIINLFNRSGKHIIGDETFFDPYLLKRCSDKPQRSSYIVGHALCDIWDEFCDSSIGDLFLYHRLKALANKGKITISNPHEDAERAKLVFDVRNVG